MEAQHDPQARVTDMTANEVIDGAVTGQPDQIGQHPRHVGPAAEGHMPKPLEPDPETGLAGFQERFVPRDITGRHASDLRPHRIQIAGILEDLAIVEADAIVGRHRPQFDIIGQPPAAELPKLLQQEGCRDDGRAGVEGEAILPVHIGPAARRIQLFQHGDPIAPRPNRTAAASPPNPLPITTACGASGESRHGLKCRAGESIIMFIG
jgi:hypothetical protein